MESSPTYCTKCGNRAQDTGETCDDGNIVSGDGCSRSCVVEAGYTCNGEFPTTCILDFICQDGQFDPLTEECDDGNDQNNDGCSFSC